LNDAQRSGLGEGRQNMMAFPAEPHNKYILFNGEANTWQAFAKPHVVCCFIYQKS